MLDRATVDGGTGPTITGLRRVDWIRVLVGDDGPRAEAVGVSHRCPTTAPITMAAAVRLVAGGALLVLRDLRVEA
jgi:hypothetical protein